MPKVCRSALSVFNYSGVSHKTEWYRITNKAEAGPTQIHIYDEIGMWGVSAGQFINELADTDGPLEVHLSTPGGEVFDGIAIYNALRQRQPTIIIDSLAASIGSVIAQAAAPGQLFIEPSARMMIHDGFAMAAGNAEELTKIVEQLNAASDTIAGIYAARTGKPLDYWREQMKAETWYSAQDAVAAGLADKVRAQVTNHADLELDNDVSNALAGIFQLHNPYFNAAQPHGPMTGSHSHPHPANGAQGGDVSHTHDHSHDDDADHGHSHGSATEAKACCTSCGPDCSCSPGNPSPDCSSSCNCQSQTDHAHVTYWNAKYKQADRDRMAKSGEAMPDGSYPVADEEDLGNAIKAVGRGSADHDDIRAHIIKRAKALGKSDQIPDNWNADGSLQTSDSSNLSELFLNALGG